MQKRHIIAREHEEIWPSADERVRCDGIWPRESETYQYDAGLQRRQAGTMEFDQAQPNADGSQKYWSRTFAHPHALMYSRVEKFSKDFFVPKVFESWKNDFR